jgi:hypothetical protein
VAVNISVPNSAILEGPHVNWKHIDGPLMTWAGHLHWLTWGERLRLAFRLATIDDIAGKHWPGLVLRRRMLAA